MSLLVVAALLTGGCGDSNDNGPKADNGAASRSAAQSLERAMAQSARAIDGVRSTRASLEQLGARLQPGLAQTGDVIVLLTGKADSSGLDVALLGAAREQRAFLQSAMDALAARTRRAGDAALTAARQAGRRASDQYAQIASAQESALAGLLPSSTTFNTGRLRDAVRSVNSPKSSSGGGAPPIPQGPQPPTGNTGETSVFAGHWTGEATQYAPSGSTQRVGMTTIIEASGRSGTHSEFIVGASHSNDCRGVITSVSYGAYAYTERADSGCIAHTSIQLTPDGSDALRFSETYVTKSGKRGRVVGRLTRG